jgi:hypothetical protein
MQLITIYLQLNYTYSDVTEIHFKAGASSHWKNNSYLKCINNSVLTSQRRKTVCITKNDQELPIMEVISIYTIARPYETHTFTTWTKCRVSQCFSRWHINLSNALKNLNLILSSPLTTHNFLSYYLNYFYFDFKAMKWLMITFLVP